jgi:hypothetical protein
MPERRDVLRGLVALLPLTMLRSHNAYAANKNPICAGCTGNGQCKSGYCVNGYCAESNEVCGFTRRANYTCKDGAAVCCFTRRKRGRRRCSAI